MKEFRVYNKGTTQYELYREMHENQDLQYVKTKYLEYEELDNCVMSIKIALSLLDNFIDPSDPDLDVPDPGHAGSGSSGETSSKPSDDEESETGTVFKTDKPSYKGVDGKETEDPTDRPGYIYGDDEIDLPTFARDLPLYWKLKAHAGEEDEVMTASPVKTFVYKQKKRKRGPRVGPGGFR